MKFNRDVVFAAVVVVIMGAGAAVGLQPAGSEIAAYPVTANVSGPVENISVGVSVDREKVDFGQVPADAVQVKKELTVQNHGGERVRFALQTRGNITPYLTLEPGTVTLHPQENKTVDVVLETTEEITTGVYAGELAVLEQQPLWRRVVR